MNKSRLLGAVSALLSIMFGLPTTAISATVDYSSIQRTASSTTSETLQYGFRCGTNSASLPDAGAGGLSVSSDSISGGCDSRDINVAFSSGAYAWSDVLDTGWSFSGGSEATVTADAAWGTAAGATTKIDLIFSSNVFVNLDILSTFIGDDSDLLFSITKCDGAFLSCSALSGGNGAGFEALDVGINGLWQDIGFELIAGNYRFDIRTKAGALSYFSQPGEYELKDLEYTVSFVSAVPVPAAVWLFGSGLMGLVGVARRKKAA